MYGFPFSSRKKKTRDDYLYTSRYMGFVGNGNNDDFKKQILQKDKEINILLN